MNRRNQCIFLCLLTIGLHGCRHTTKTAPFLVLHYEGQKVIELYSSPQIAIVDGESGSWHDSGIADMRYEVHYGSKECVISTTKSMIYFGSVEDAIDNLRDESKWIPFRRKH